MQIVQIATQTGFVLKQLISCAQFSIGIGQMQKVCDKPFHLFLCRGVSAPLSYVVQYNTVIKKLAEEPMELLHIEVASRIYFVNCHTRVCQH